MAASCKSIQNSWQRIYRTPTSPHQQRNTLPTDLPFRHKDAGVSPTQLLPHRLSHVELLPRGGGGRRPPRHGSATERPGGARALRTLPPRHAPAPAAIHVPPRPPPRGGVELLPRGSRGARSTDPLRAGRGAAPARRRGWGTRTYLHFRQALPGGRSLPPLLVLLRRSAAVPGAREPQRHPRRRAPPTAGPAAYAPQRK